MCCTPGGLLETHMKILLQTQIDHILVNRRYKNYCISVKTYLGAGIHSDHYPLVGVFKVKVKKIRKNTVIRNDLRKRKEYSVRDQV